MPDNTFSTELFGNPYIFMIVVFIVTILLPESIYSYLTNLSIKERITNVRGNVISAMLISLVLGILSFANMSWVLRTDASYTQSTKVVLDDTYGGISATVQLLIYIIASLMFVYATVSLTNAVKKLSHTISKMAIMLVFYAASVANLFFLQWKVVLEVECSNYILSVIYVCMATPFVVYAIGMLLTGLVVRRVATNASEKQPAADTRTPEQRIAQASSNTYSEGFPSISTEPETRPPVTDKRAETKAEIERSLEHVAQVAQEIAAAAAKLPEPPAPTEGEAAKSDIEKLPYVSERAAELKAVEKPKAPASEIMVKVKLPEDITAAETEPAEAEEIPSSAVETERSEDAAPEDKNAEQSADEAQPDEKHGDAQTEKSAPAAPVKVITKTGKKNKKKRRAR